MFGESISFIACVCFSQEAAGDRPDPRDRDGVRGVREGAEAGRGEEGLGAAVRGGLRLQALPLRAAGDGAQRGCESGMQRLHCIAD